MARYEFRWDPSDPGDPGPCIDVIVMNSQDVIDKGRENGLEYPVPLKVRALLDTGASVTVISKTFAKYCKLFQTQEGGEITALGARLPCGEHAGAISFPKTDLQGFALMRIVSADFKREPNYSCLIGRDILRNWEIKFDGRKKLVTIVD
jgi:gag-polyprotein putative aspartyl protease